MPNELTQLDIRYVKQFAHYLAAAQKGEGIPFLKDQALQRTELPCSVCWSKQAQLAYSYKEAETLQQHPICSKACQTTAYYVLEMPAHKKYAEGYYNVVADYLKEKEFAKEQALHFYGYDPLAENGTKASARHFVKTTSMQQEDTHTPVYDIQDTIPATDSLHSEETIPTRTATNNVSKWFDIENIRNDAHSSSSPSTHETEKEKINQNFKMRQDRHHLNKKIHQDNQEVASSPLTPSQEPTNTPLTSSKPQVDQNHEESVSTVIRPSKRQESSAQAGNLKKSTTGSTNDEMEYGDCFYCEKESIPVNKHHCQSCYHLHMKNREKLKEVLEEANEAVNRERYTRLQYIFANIRNSEHPYQPVLNFAQAEITQNGLLLPRLGIVIGFDFIVSLRNEMTQLAETRHTHISFPHWFYDICLKNRYGFRPQDFKDFMPLLYFAYNRSLSLTNEKGFRFDNLKHFEVANLLPMPEDAYYGTGYPMLTPYTKPTQEGAPLALPTSSLKKDTAYPLALREQHLPAVQESEQVEPENNAQPIAKPSDTPIYDNEEGFHKPFMARTYDFLHAFNTPHQVSSEGARTKAYQGIENVSTKIGSFFGKIFGDKKGGKKPSAFGKVLGGMSNAFMEAGKEASRQAKEEKHRIEEREQLRREQEESDTINPHHTANEEWDDQHSTPGADKS